MTITGKVIKKEKKKNPIKVELLVEVNGEVIVFQVRPKNVIKLVEIDTGCKVQIKYKNELSNRINNLIVEDIIKA